MTKTTDERREDFLNALAHEPKDSLNDWAVRTFSVVGFLATMPTEDTDMTVESIQQIMLELTKGVPNSIALLGAMRVKSAMNTNNQENNQ